MGAFATVTLPVDLTRCHDAAGVVASVVGKFGGTRRVDVDTAASTVTFELHFPGNLTGLVRKLRDNLIPAGDHAKVSVPIQSLVPELIAAGPTAITERLVEGAHVWDVAFERGAWVADATVVNDRVVATIVSSTNGMHQIYDALLSLGVVVNDLELAAARGR